MKIPARLRDRFQLKVFGYRVVVGTESMNRPQVINQIRLYLLTPNFESDLVNIERVGAYIVLIREDGTRNPPVIYILDEELVIISHTG